MFRTNKRHLQPHLFSDLDRLAKKRRQRLEESWAGTYRREVHGRLDEGLFAVLYKDVPSRPNTPVNLLLDFEIFKSGFGWSDAQTYDHFMFDLQVRYAAGLDNLGEGDFDLRTVYNFRLAVCEHMQESGENLMERALAQVSDEQCQAFKLKTGQLRVDSTQVASNIRRMTRLQLLVEVLQRVHRMLSAADQARYAEAFAPYLKGSSGQYVYHIRGDDTAPHMQRIGDLMYRLVAELSCTYAQEPTYQTLQRVFSEQYTVTETMAQARPGQEVSPSSLRSPDDPGATFRRKGDREYEGYVTAVTETAAVTNPFQLVVKVQTAPNNTEDATLLAEALPELKARTGVEVIYNDAGFCGPAVDAVLREQQVIQVPTELRGRTPNPEKLHLADFEIQQAQDELLPADTDPGPAENKQQALLNADSPVDGRRREPRLDTTSSSTAAVSQFPEPASAQCPSAADEQAPASPDAASETIVEEQVAQQEAASGKPALGKPCASAQTVAGSQITCPHGQKAFIENGRNPGRYCAYFADTVCQGCPLLSQCPARPGKLDPRHRLGFSQKDADVAGRRRRRLELRIGNTNPRSAIEATVGALKRPFSDDQLPVRGQFRMGAMMIASAAMLNVRRITRYLAANRRRHQSEQAPNRAKDASGESPSSFLSLLSAWLQHSLPPAGLARPTLAFCC
jgi:hypothetical protein